MLYRLTIWNDEDGFIRYTRSRFEAKIMKQNYQVKGYQVRIEKYLL